MSNLGFDNYVEPLKLYLQKYREVYLYLFIMLKQIKFTHIKYGKCLKATKGDKSIGIEELSDDVFCKLTITELALLFLLLHFVCY